MRRGFLRKNQGASTCFPGGSDSKESACNAGHPCSIPGSGISPENPLQYSCLGNPMDRGAWWATVHGKEADTAEGLTPAAREQEPESRGSTRSKPQTAWRQEQKHPIPGPGVQVRVIHVSNLSPSTSMVGFDLALRWGGGEADSGTHKLHVRTS